MGNYRSKRDKKLAKVSKSCLEDLQRLQRKSDQFSREDLGSKTNIETYVSARDSINDASIYLFRV